MKNVLVNIRKSAGAGDEVHEKLYKKDSAYREMADHIYAREIETFEETCDRLGIVVSQASDNTSVITIQLKNDPNVSVEVMPQPKESKLSIAPFVDYKENRVKATYNRKEEVLVVKG